MKQYMLAAAGGLFVATVVFGQTGVDAKAGNPAEGNPAMVKREPFVHGGAVKSHGSSSFNPAMSGGVPPFVLGKVLADPKAVTELGLTEEKVKILKDSMDQGQKQNEIFRKLMIETDQAKRKLMEENSMDENAFIVLAEKAAQARLDMEKTNIKHMILVKKTLTQEQLTKMREKLNDIMHEHAKQMREHKSNEDKPENPADKKEVNPENKK